MANTFVKIASVTVGVGGAASIDFTSIPQTYTDLKVVLSARTDYAITWNLINFNFNSSTTGYTARQVFGTGSAAGSNSLSVSVGSYMPGTSMTSSVFGNSETYIPNYTSSQYKAFSWDAVVENNGTSGLQSLGASLWSNTAAITSISVVPEFGNFIQYSTATLYGIKSS